MGKMSVYGFHRVSVLVNLIPIQGFMDGDDVIKVTPADQAVGTLVGADGNPIVSVSLDESAIIELKLKPDSISNGVLTALEIAFRKSSRALPFPLAISNYQNLEIDTAAECCVLQRTPEKSYGKNATARTWRIFAAHLKTATIGEL